MSEKIRVRLLLAKWPDDTEPSVVAAVDQTIWEHWDDEGEAAWRKEGQRLWGIDETDLEWREVWAEFHPQHLVDAFKTPVVEGAIGG